MARLLVLSLTTTSSRGCSCAGREACAGCVKVVESISFGPEADRAVEAALGDAIRIVARLTPSISVDACSCQELSPSSWEVLGRSRYVKALRGPYVIPASRSTASISMAMAVA